MSSVILKQNSGSRVEASATPRVIVTMFIVFIVGLYTILYFTSPNLPDPSVPHSGWATWWDQGKYLEAAAAWANWDLNSNLHWYFPGYALLTAPFYLLMPSHPFFLPDAVLLAIFIVLFFRICENLGVNHTTSGLIILATVILPPAIFTQFILPWNTTPTAAIILGILLSSQLYLRRHGRVSAFAMGACGGSLILFRPTDMVVLPVMTLFAVVSAFRTGGVRLVIRDGLIFWAGFALTAGAGIAVYLTLYGMHESEYMRQAAGIGFDFYQLPEKWVSIVLDPTPLFPGQQGILQAYPWLALGFVGLVQLAFLKFSKEHALIALPILIYLTVYLSFVDLLPTGLWTFHNVHYLKWTLPFLGLFGYLGVKSLEVPKNRLAFVIAFAICALPLSLHLQVNKINGASARSDGSRKVFVSNAPKLSAIDVPLTTGDTSTLYLTEHLMQADDKILRHIADFHVIAVADGARIVLLHHYVAKHYSVELAKGNITSPVADISPLSVSLGLGWPRWLAGSVAPLNR